MLHDFLCVYYLNEMDKQRRLDEYFMGVAKLTASLSYAERKKVGAVIVKDKRICSIGYNGTPSKFDNCCEDHDADGNLVTKHDVVHAESNAIFWCAKTGIKTEGATLYLTLSPCSTCALGIIQSGIAKVVYDEEYRDTRGIELLIGAGIEVKKFNN